MTTQNKTASINGLLLASGEIEKNCKNIRKNGAALDTLIHTTAVAIIVQSLPADEGGHLDCSRAKLLMDAMPKGMRSKALIAWFTEFSNIRFSPEGKVSLLTPQKHAKMYRQARPIEANATPYHTWSNEAEPVPKEFGDAQLASMLHAIQNRIKAAQEAGTLKVTPAVLNKVNTELAKVLVPVDNAVERNKKQAKAEAARLKTATAKLPSAPSAAALAKAGVRDAPAKRAATAH